MLMLGNLMHEIGHAIGMNHESLGVGAISSPFKLKAEAFGRHEIRAARALPPRLLGAHGAGCAKALPVHARFEVLHGPLGLDSGHLEACQSHSDMCFTCNDGPTEAPTCRMTRIRTTAMPTTITCLGAVRWTQKILNKEA